MFGDGLGVLQQRFGKTPTYFVEAGRRPQKKAVNGQYAVPESLHRVYSADMPTFCRNFCARNFRVLSVLLKRTFGAKGPCPHTCMRSGLEAPSAKTLNAVCTSPKLR